MIQSLTGLRLYAALLVFVTHFFLFDYFYKVPRGSYYLLLEGFGVMGVSVFFILSGFILYLNYLAPHKKSLNVKQFYWARFARIYPVFLVAFLLALPIQLLSHDSVPIVPLALWNLSLLHCWPEGFSGVVNPPDWSIGHEAFFYSVFPLLALMFRPKIGRWFWVFTLLYGGYMVWNIFLGGYWPRATWPLNRLLEFWIGMVAGYVYCQWPSPMWLKVWLDNRTGQRLVLAVLGALVLLMMLAPVFHNFYFGVHQLYTLVGGTTIILTLAYAENFGRVWGFLTHPWVIYGGEISYSFYLIHQVIIRYFRHGLYYGFHLDAFYFPQWVKLLLFWGLMATGLVVAHVMYQRIETPCRQFLRKLV